MKGLTASILFVLMVQLHAQTDSLKVLSYQNFLEIVAVNHPVSIRAGLMVNYAAAGEMKAKGVFDPKVFAASYQKYFDDKKYYNLTDAGLKIPVWPGMDLKAGFEQNTGQLLNPENSLPASGILYGGVEVNVGQGLFIDARRAILQQAQIALASSEQERILMVNDLLYEASVAYWDWYLQFTNAQIMDEAVSTALERLEAVRVAVRLGDRPGLDTVEASIQWQNLRVSMESVQIELMKAQLVLSTFLWADGIEPLLLDPDTTPENPSTSSVFDVDESRVNPIPITHPLRQYFDLKLEFLDIEQRWQKEQLKPILRLSYNPLAEVLGNETFSAYSPSNYTWGVSFEMPLFLRKERGQLQMTNITIEQTILEQELKIYEWNNKALSLYNERRISTNQIAIYTNTVNDYKRLMEGEMSLFNLGESSLFLINARQQSFINAQIKLIELEKKNGIAAAGIVRMNAGFGDWYSSKLRQ
jgi:outer membrane protein TolC